MALYCGYFDVLLGKEAIHAYSNVLDLTSYAGKELNKIMIANCMAYGALALACEEAKLFYKAPASI